LCFSFHRLDSSRSKRFVRFLENFAH